MGAPAGLDNPRPVTQEFLKDIRDHPRVLPASSLPKGTHLRSVFEAAELVPASGPLQALVLPSTLFLALFTADLPHGSDLKQMSYFWQALLSSLSLCLHLLQPKVNLAILVCSLHLSTSPTLESKTEPSSSCLLPAVTQQKNIECLLCSGWCSRTVWAGQCPAPWSWYSRCCGDQSEGWSFRRGWGGCFSQWSGKVSLGALLLGKSQKTRGSNQRTERSPQVLKVHTSTPPMVPNTCLGHCPGSWARLSSGVGSARQRSRLRWKQRK